MTLRGATTLLTSSPKTVEETVVYRSNWELTVYVRDHIASLADERRTCSLIAQNNDRPARLLTQLRHRLGISLILVGRALADYDAVRALPTPPGRPAPWGQPSS